MKATVLRSIHKALEADAGIHYDSTARFVPPEQFVPSLGHSCPRHTLTLDSKAREHFMPFVEDDAAAEMMTSRAK